MFEVWMNCEANIEFAYEDIYIKFNYRDSNLGTHRVYRV